MAGWNDFNILKGFLRYAHKASWSLDTNSIMIGTIPRNWQTADGMLATNSPRRDVQHFLRKASAVIPAVLLGPDRLKLGIPRVDCDDIAAGRMAAEYLLEQGHKTFAYSSHTNGTHSGLRLKGFRERLAKSGRTCTVFCRAGGSTDNISEWLKGRLKRLKPPLGILAVDDVIASETIEAVLACGLRVPKDVAVMGIGSLDLVCKYARIPITSIALPTEQQASESAAILDRLMSNQAAPQKTLILPPSQIIIRQSTDYMAVTHPVVKSALDFITENLLTETLSLSNIARAAGVSTTLLYTLFHSELNCTPQEHVRKLRMRRACDLLLNTSEKIGSISNQCGFSNLRTFQRTFRKLEGMHPHPWRKIRQKNGTVH